MHARVALLVGIVLSLSGCIAPEGTDATENGEATHRWMVSIQPETDEPYEIDVPFLVTNPDSERYVPPLEALRERIVMQPGGQIEWLDGPEGYLRISGQGPLVVEAKRSFDGGVGEREAFLGWRVAGNQVHSVTGGPLTVTWSVDHSGGTGHTCWASATWVAEVDAGATAPLLDDGDGDAPEDGRIVAMCA